MDLSRDLRVVSVDIGTTQIKVVKYKHNDYYYEVYRREDIPAIVKRAIAKEYDVILLTGSGASYIDEDAYLIDQKSIPVIRMNELECVANIAVFEGYDEALIVNIGTGTSFVHFDHFDFQHITGTGIGGGTFEGLGRRLLDVHDPDELQTLADKGEVEQVNIVIQDIYEKDLSWLHSDITVSNFAKDSKDNEDVAIGIHSLVIEPIISMVKGILSFGNIDKVVFSGGVLNNAHVIELIKKYSKFFEIPYQVLENPSFGTAIGAIEIYKRQRK